MTPKRRVGPHTRRIIALCLLLGAVACQGPQNSLAAADLRIAQGDVAGACVLLRRLVANPPRETAGEAHAQGVATQALMRLARLNTFDLHDYPQALADWAALRAQSDCPQALVQEALRQSADILRHALGRPEDAVVLLRQARAQLGAHAEGARVRAELLTTLLEQGNLDDARTEAQGIVERWPARPEAMSARLALGQIAFATGNFAGAYHAYESALDAHPGAQTTAQVLVAQGDCLQELGDVPRALEAYFAALKDHPNPAVVQAKVARVRARLYHLAPQDRILNASRPSRHVAAWQPRPTPVELGFDHVPPRRAAKLGPSRP